MSRLSTVVRSSLPYLAAFGVGFAMVFSASVLLAQDSAIVHDRTGLFGPIIDKFWPVIVTFLTSLTVKLIAKANAVFARTGEPVKWAALYAFALLYNLFAGWLNIAAVDPTGPMFGLAMVQTAAAAMVYKFGQRKMPAV